jgi:hypothetical protein
MGWLTYYREREESDRDHLQRELWPSGQCRIGECGTAGGTFYALCEPAAEDEPFALIVLQRRTRGQYNYGRKELTESSGPYESQCPARVLDAIERAIPVPPNEWAEEWRSRCRENIVRRQAAKSVKSGTWIELASPLVFSDGVGRSLLQFIGRSSFCACDGVRVRVSNWRTLPYAVVES